MLKTYQFKTHCKGDSHSSKTANIILPGLMMMTSLLYFAYRRGPILIVRDLTQLTVDMKNPLHKIHNYLTYIAYLSVTYNVKLSFKTQ